MIKIAICDDESPNRNALAKIIKEHFYNIQRSVLIKVFASGEKLLDAKMRFDIIFLDIEMPVLDGIETAVKLRNWDVNSKIIYVTNYNNYKKAAYKVHAFEYINKPIVKNEIENILTEAMRYIDNRFVPKKLAIKTENEMVILEVDDIYYFEYSARKLSIVTSDGVYASTYYSLKEINEKIKKYYFASPHRSYIVNLLHVKLIKGALVYGDDIPLAQKQAVAFRNNYTEFLNTTFD